MSVGELPSLTIGMKDDKQSKVEILARHRPRGTAIIGQPGTGKSSLSLQLIEQDIAAGCAVLVIDPHDLIKELLPRIPKDRWKDVVIISLRHDRPPIWPVLEIARHSSEQLTIAHLLVDSWRAQYGRESIGPRAEGILEHSLLLFPGDFSISPLELQAAITNNEFRQQILQLLPLEGERYPLSLYWQKSMQALTERTVQEWSQAIANKLAPFLLNDWLRRATCGVAPAITFEKYHPMGVAAKQYFETILDDPEQTDLKMVIWLKDRYLGYRFGENPRPQICEIENQLDPYLITSQRNGKVFSPAFPSGYKVDEEYPVDFEDPHLQPPSLSEIQEYGAVINDDVDRRRRRRGWSHLVNFVLKPRGIAARESIDIADMLDDRRIVLVEVPTIYGREVTSLAGTMAFLSAVTRGQRQLFLPPHRRVPCAMYIDEASLFLNEGVERTLAELRKANVSLTLILQRLGQLGAVNSAFRRGVTDTIGTIITLPLGIEEVKDAARMFSNVEEKQLAGLHTGEGFMAGLEANGQLQPAQKFTFKMPELVESPEDGLILRQQSIDRYYQSRAAADAIFKERIVNMRRYGGKISGGGSDKGKEGSKMKAGLKQIEKDEDEPII